MEPRVKRCLKLRFALQKSLKDDFPLYMSSVFEWIRKRKTRAELDSQVCSLLKESVRKYHWDFLVSLAKLCWGLSSLRIENLPLPAMTVGISSLDTSTRLTDQKQNLEDDGNVLKRKRYKELSIPGLELVRARLYLAAWDAGLTNVDPKVGQLLHTAMRHYIKDVIQTTITIKPPSIEPNKNTTIGAFAIWCALMRTNCDRPSIQFETFAKSST